MKSPIPVLIAILVSMVFWTLLSVVRILGATEGALPTFVFFLVLAEPLAHGLLLWGLWKRRRWAYVLGIPFAGVNALLSLTDEAGFLDILSFFLSAALLVLLLFSRRAFAPRTKS